MIDLDGHCSGRDESNSGNHPGPIELIESAHNSSRSKSRNAVEFLR